MTDHVLAALDKLGVAGSSVRLVDLDVRPGVEKGMGDGDEWPGVTPETVSSTIATMTTNAVHLATLLRDTAYPPT